MYFIKTTTAPNFSIVEYHEVISVVLERDAEQFQVLVHSWATEGAHAASYDPVWREQHLVPVDGIDYSKGYEQGMVNYLAAMDGTLKDATKHAKKSKN